MKDFVFYNSARIIFGKNALNGLCGMLTEFGANKILLHYGKGSAVKSGLLDKVKAEAEKLRIPCVELGGVIPNPRITLVEEGIELVRREGVDFILAVGGGSVIDSAKAIAVGAAYKGNMWDDMFMKGLEPRTRLHLGVILTTAGTGSEASKSCVVTNFETGYKRSIKGDALVPDFSICNPEFTYTLPKKQTAYGACDIFSHLAERYFTPDDDNELTDELLFSAMRTVIKYSAIALRNPSDYNARAQLMLASTMAHNDMLGMGRKGDWASHKIEHELSAVFDIPHGAGLAIVLPAWIKYNYSKKPGVFDKLASEVFNVSGKNMLDKLLLSMREWFKSMGLCTTLGELGIRPTPAQISEFAYRCRLYRGDIGEFNKLDSKKIEEIYKLM